MKKMRTAAKLINFTETKQGNQGISVSILLDKIVAVESFYNYEMEISCITIKTLGSVSYEILDKDEDLSDLVEGYICGDSEIIEEICYGFEVSKINIIK